MKNINSVQLVICTFANQMVVSPHQFATLRKKVKSRIYYKHTQSNDSNIIYVCEGQRY